MRSFVASSEFPNVHSIASAFAGRRSDFHGSLLRFQYGLRTASAVRPCTHCLR
jgi:hypothetical protein